MLKFDVFEEIGAPIADIEPGGAGGGWADRLAPPPPEPALATRAIAADPPGLARGGMVAALEDLPGQADDGAGRGWTARVLWHS